jgi:hypothetical protein
MGQAGKGDRRMKARIVLAVAVLLLAGCSLVPVPGLSIQSILNAELPANFTGNARIEHKNPYFDVTIDVKGLRHADGAWVWDSLEYLRNGRVSQGRVTLQRLSTGSWTGDPRGGVGVSRVIPLSE